MTFIYHMVMLSIGILASPTWAFEKTTVLPKGVRNLNLKTVTTTISHKTNGTGVAEPLAKPLEKNLTFQKIVDGEQGTKRHMLEAFLMDRFALTDSLGSFQAEMKGGVSVYAAIMSYGVTDRLSLAVGVPYYRAKMSISLGFQPTDTAQSFVNQLHDENFNQTQAAREAAGKINDAVGELQQKLKKHGYSALATWEGHGVGDSTIAAKYLAVDQNRLKCATVGGFIAPTGRLNDPDHLIDVPFGDNSWNLFASALLDQPLWRDVVINEYVKYTYQAPTSQALRRVTHDEAIEVDTKQTHYKLGNKIDAGASFQYEPAFGLLAGMGYNYSHKYQDRYHISDNLPSKLKLEEDTMQSSHYMEARLGYSTIPAFKRQEFAAPLNISVEYKKHLASLNTPMKDLMSLDVALFF